MCSTFKSSIHTDNLYPGSSVATKYAKFDLEKLPTKDQTFSGYIPMNEIQFTYSHSSGPGGSNVNKVRFNNFGFFEEIFNFSSSQNLTKVDLRFHLDSASWLSQEVKEIIKLNHAGELTKDGFLIVKSDRTRSRQLNQADCLQKLRHFIWASVSDVRTHLEKNLIDDVEKEKMVKAQQKAARERVKSKRIYSQRLKDKKSFDL